MPAHFGVNQYVILSTSSSENMVGQSMFAIADLILFFVLGFRIMPDFSFVWWESGTDTLSLP